MAKPKVKEPIEKDAYASQKNYAEQMRYKGFRRYTTWVPDTAVDVKKVADFTAKLRNAHKTE